MSKKFDFPLVEHHETVRRTLSEAVDKKEITAAEADTVFNDWLKRRQEAKNKRKRGIA